MTHQDLISYKPIIAPALEGSYHGNKELPPRRIYTTHAPTSGPVVLHILNLLEGYNLTMEGPTPLNTHRTVEALKCKLTTINEYKILLPCLVGYAARFGALAEVLIEAKPTPQDTTR